MNSAILTFREIQAILIPVRRHKPSPAVDSLQPKVPPFLYAGSSPSMTRTKSGACDGASSRTARVMDGELPAVEDGGLWLEAYQLLEMVYAGVLGLELSLDLAERQNSGIHLQAGLVI